jgi:hypothetical protein
MTIYRTILSKGYLPKELPPYFSSESFAAYATTRAGRSALRAAKLANNCAECTAFTLALPGLEHRPLSIPHPKVFSDLVAEISRSFRRLLTKAGTSKISRSRPVFSNLDHRAIRGLIDPSNLSRERAIARSCGSFLLKADISHFYPSLYTHAVGWAIDPKSRTKTNWRNNKLLGVRVDQLLMNLQGKVSQGLPTGNDVSFLLAEIVLGQVDKELKIDRKRAFRWFDDYEISCDSRAEAEESLVQLRAALKKFHLRINSKKTAILELPLPTGESWQHQVLDASRDAQLGHRYMTRFFDSAFEVRARHPSSPVLLYAIGLLFKISVPSGDVLRVAESCISQALLCEPGCAQKTFALLTFWRLNGAPLSLPTIGETIERIVCRHGHVGATSDVSWALAFSIAERVPLSAGASKALSQMQEDCAVVQVLHAHSSGLLAKSFSPKAIEAWLRAATPDGPHWLALYEAVRHGFLPRLAAKVQSDPLFADMLLRGVSFYRTAMPPYAAVVHQGGAPQWVVRAWLSAASTGTGSSPPKAAPPDGRTADMIKDDASRLAGGKPYAEAVARLLAAMQSRGADNEETDPYT